MKTAPTKAPMLHHVMVTSIKERSCAGGKETGCAGLPSFEKLTMGRATNLGIILFGIPIMVPGKIIEQNILDSNPI